jgi:hypothetical protein
MGVQNVGFAVADFEPRLELLAADLSLSTANHLHHPVQRWPEPLELRSVRQLLEQSGAWEWSNRSFSEVVEEFRALCHCHWSSKRPGMLGASSYPRAGVWWASNARQRTGAWRHASATLSVKPFLVIDASRTSSNRQRLLPLLGLEVQICRVLAVGY